MEVLNTNLLHPRQRVGENMQRWQEAGAEWIHLVDLDAAFGHGHNRELQARIVGELDIQVELSGGIRDDESLEAAMTTGCRRVNIGTAALEHLSQVVLRLVEFALLVVLSAERQKLLGAVVHEAVAW